MSEDTERPDFVMHPGEKTTMLFMQMVFQLSSLATLLMGKAPHPDTGKTTRDLQSAQVVIDQLDMLQTKTKGNLTAEEDKLLRQTLMSLRMAYVEAVNQPASAAEESEAEKAAPSAETATSESAEAEETTATESSDAKKKFTKKY